MSNCVFDVDREKLVELIEATRNKKRYRLGAKPPLDSKPEEWDEADCSGYVRWFLRNCTPGKITPPDGSWHQLEWCEDRGFKRCVDNDGKPAYNADNVGLSDDRLRIAFIKPRGKRIGHVWLILNGKTIESWGGHGPGRRSWNVKPLLSRVTQCFVLTEPLNTA